MKVLLQKAKIVCQHSGYHNQVKDILIVDGKIHQISNDIISEDATCIHADALHVSTGWVDIFAQFCDPGYEFRETLESGSNAAAAGGFTDVMIIPNTNPVVCSKSQVEYIIQKSKSLISTIHPLGAITKNAEGKALAEMYDMHSSGAVAFTDGTNPLQDANIMIKALQYALATNSVIIQVPDEKNISAHGLINEGVISTQMGLPGIPAIAEELMIARDIELLQYTQSNLHITSVSTQKGMELIANAKQAGLAITCSVTPYHLHFCDEDLTGYQTNLKLNPPLRTKADMLFLRSAVSKGLVDCIASHHTPLHWDDKTCEFEYAKYGMIGLETLFGVVSPVINDIELLVSMLTEKPRTTFGLSIPTIEEGADACLSFFDPTCNYTFEEKMIQSTSKNSPFIGKTLHGKVLGIINKGKVLIN